MERSLARCPWDQQLVGWQLISTIDNKGVLPGAEVDPADGDYVRGDLAIHRFANGDDIC